MLTPHMLERIHVKTEGSFSFICFNRSTNNIEKYAIRHLMKDFSIQYKYIPGDYHHECAVWGGRSDIPVDKIDFNRCSRYQISTDDLVHFTLLGI